MRVCFEIFICGGKKNEAFLMCASRSSFSNVINASRNSRSKKCEHNTVRKECNRCSKKERGTAADEREFFCVFALLLLFCHFFPRSLCCWNYHPRKDYEQQQRDFHEDDVLLLRLKLLLPVFFFFETVVSNWTGREKKELFFEIFNIIIFITIIGGKSG